MIGSFAHECLTAISISKRPETVFSCLYSSIYKFQKYVKKKIFSFPETKNRLLNNSPVVNSLIQNIKALPLESTVVHFIAVEKGSLKPVPGARLLQQYHVLPDCSHLSVLLQKGYRGPKDMQDPDS